jgi:ATP-dependent Clp protease ATP-binding subunit ClpA
MDILPMLSDKIIGQPQALSAIVPYVQMYHSGLAPEGRPAGVFLLLGPTGTGKTRTVEALAEVLTVRPGICFASIAANTRWSMKLPN